MKREPREIVVTTEIIRKRAAWDSVTMGREFDRWLEEHDAEVLARQVPEDAEAERMRGVLDRHLPTIITGLSKVVHDGIGYKSRDDRTPDDIAIMAALSAAHWIAKEIATGSGEPLYDLPGVLDLLEVNRRIQADRDASNPYAQRGQ